MVSFEFIKPDMYSVNTGRHTNECLFAAHPVWVVKPQDTSLEEGKPGYLHCQAKASPEPEVTWIRNNLMLMPEVTHTRGVFFFFPKHAIHLSNFIKSLLYFGVQVFKQSKITTNISVFFFTPPRTLVLSYSVMVPSGSTMWRFTTGRCTAAWLGPLPADCLDTLGFLSSVSYEGHSDHQLNTLDSDRACKFVFGAMKGDINQMCFSCRAKHENEMRYGPACSADLGSSFYMDFPLCVSAAVVTFHLLCGSASADCWLCCV